MDGPQGVAVSPDGGNVYVASYDDTLVVFGRDASDGTLTYLETLRDGVDGVNGLAGAQSVVVSPDDEHVYVAGGEDNAVAVFRRGAEGRLTFIEFKKDGQGGVDGLHGAETVALSPDGKFLYVAGDIDDAIAVFERDASSGTLTFVEVQKDGIGGVDGLDKVRCATISPDGKHVYAAGSLDDAVVVFSRNPTTGRLTFVEMHKDNTGGVDGLARARAAAVSPDGTTVYVAGGDDNALAIFARNPATGRLTFQGVVRDGVNGVDGLEGVQEVVVSTDGERVYAVSDTDDALAIFTRDPATGLLTFATLFRDNQDGVEGLDLAHGVTISPDGRNVYTVAVLDDSVVVFGGASCGNGQIDAGEECDDGNALSGDCCSSSCRAEAEGGACSDGAFCTDGDVCVAGVCQGAPRDCSASGDACSEGACDEAANECVAQPKGDGASCDDGDACTQEDTCVGGSCHGGDPVVCDDQCTSGGGACDPLTGLCGGTPLPDGTACDDGNACTHTDTCVAGTCTGGSPVVCGDPCMAGGTCDPVTGLCGGDEMPDGTPCDDGNACTRVDSCSNGTCTGGNPVICDGCTTGGACDPSTGVCTGGTAQPDGTPCEDGNRCTDSDTCSGGACVSGPQRQCEAGACHEAGTCDPLTGVCLNPPKSDGTGCDDGDACTTGDSCWGDMCKGEPAGDTDEDGFCDPIDLCPEVWNPDQWDMNHDGVGDMCQCNLMAPGRCMPGGGKKKSDCLVEFNYAGYPTLNKKKTRVRNTIRCQDGDRLCDMDGKGDGQCTFALTVCLANNDPTLTKCTPEKVGALEVVSPNPLGKPGMNRDNALALEQGLIATGLGIERKGQVISPSVTSKGPNYCSPTVRLVVPAPAPGGKPVKRKFRMRGFGESRKDGDRFVLRCVR